MRRRLKRPGLDERATPWHDRCARRGRPLITPPRLGREGEALTDFMDLERELRPGDARRRTNEPEPLRPPLLSLDAPQRHVGVVRVLNLLGVDLPAALYAARADNPAGYWEPLHVVEAHETFLAAIGSSFDDISPLPKGALRGGSARALEDRLVQILESEFADSRQFVIKDPRICRLVPIWIGVLQRFGAAPRFVLPVRNPLEVAASLKLRNEYATTKSLLLWLRHSLDAERHTRGFPRSVVSYENLLRDWRRTVDKIADEFALVWPRTSHAANAEIEQFLSPGAATIRSNSTSFRRDRTSSTGSRRPMGSWPLQLRAGRSKKTLSTRSEGSSIGLTALSDPSSQN